MIEGAADRSDPAAIQFVCPSCKGELDATAALYHCRSCRRTYPVLFGIPDFRLRSDRYLTLEQERAKAQRLHDYSQTATFDELVRFYYSITDDVPANLAVAYQSYILRGPERGQRVLDELVPCDGTLLDVGCGSGGLLVAAAGRYRAIIGIDIALRWLVICQSQLAERGIQATLVCADAEALPFRSGCASQVVAADLIEHVYDVGGAISEVVRTLEPDAKLWLSAANRFCIGPHASTRIWAIGFLPRRARSWILCKVKGIDLLRYSHMVSPGLLSRQLRAHGMTVLRQQPKPLPPEDEVLEVSLQERRVHRHLKEFYRRALRIDALHWILLKTGPAFELLCSRANGT